jgi:uncharacterized delta-60 repeat protein
MAFLRRVSAILALAVLPAVPAAAATDPTAPGALDRAFGHNGVAVPTYPRGLTDELPLRRSFVLGDGRTLALTEPGVVARITLGGRIDGTFGTLGWSTPSLLGDGNDSVRDMALAPDGSVVLAGTSRADRIGVVRLTPNGRIARAFNGGEPVIVPTLGYISGVAVAVGADGTTFVAYRSFPTYGSPDAAAGPRSALLALAPDGSLRSDFGEGGRFSFPAFEPVGVVALSTGEVRVVVSSYPDGRMLLAGVDAAGRPDPALGRDGVRDLGLELVPNAVTALPGDQFLVAGHVGSQPAIARFDSDGTPDPAFGAAGIAALSGRAGPIPGSAAVGPGGRVAVALTTPSIGSARPRMAVELLTARGRPVRGFGRDGFVRLPVARPKAPAGGIGVGFPAPGRLLVTGTTGDGLSSIREDFGRDDVVLARLRLRSARLRMAGKWPVSRRGVATVALRCGGGRGMCVGTLAVAGRRAAFRVGSGRRGAVQVSVGRSRSTRRDVRVTLRSSVRGPVLDTFVQTVGLRR